MDALQWMGRETKAMGNYVKANLGSSDLDNYFRQLEVYHKDENILFIGLGGLFEGNGKVFAGCDVPDGFWVLRYSTMKRIKESSKISGEIIKEKRRFSKHPFKIIARSEGGLEARGILSYLGDEAPYYIDFIGTIGTPHQGTIVPYLIPASWLIPSCLDMMPSSNFMKSLQEQRLPEGITYWNIYTKSIDELCLPYGNLIWPDNKVMNIALPNMAGHADILSDPQAWKLISQKAKEHAENSVIEEGEILG